MVTTQTKKVTETKTVGWTEQSWGKELKEKIILTPLLWRKDLGENRNEFVGISFVHTIDSLT